jgi:hypothetical protein
MLIYHPAKDAYHCVFRMLVVAERVKSLDVDMARLLDFYLLFPVAIADIRLPKNMMRIRKFAEGLSNMFRDPISIKTAFRDVANMQEVALRSIAAAGLIDVDKFESGVIVRTAIDMPETLKTKIDRYVHHDAVVLNFILDELSQFPLRGPDGLKHRTGLLEHRYDII